MNSKNESFKKPIITENISFKRNSDENLKNPHIYSERNSLDFRFLNLKSKISNKLISEKLSKISLLKYSNHEMKNINRLFSDKISSSEIMKNDGKMKYNTTNIKKMNKRIIPSMEKFKTNVKEAFSGKHILINRKCKTIEFLCKRHNI